MASEHLSFRVDSLQVDADEVAVGDLTVLDHTAVLPLTDHVHRSLLEVLKGAVRDLHV